MSLLPIAGINPGGGGSGGDASVAVGLSPYFEYQPFTVFAVAFVPQFLSSVKSRGTVPFDSNLADLNLRLRLESPATERFHPYLFLQGGVSLASASDFNAGYNIGVGVGARIGMTQATRFLVDIGFQSTKLDGPNNTNLRLHLFLTSVGWEFGL